MVAAGPYDAVDALPGRVEPADLLRVEGVGQVVDRHPRAVGVAAAELLVVDQQQAVRDLHLVGVASAGDVHWRTRRRSAGSDASRIDVPAPLGPKCPT